ncbi:hypothetical protein D1007_39969 [Hordeum vulgare]|nr:hypothetical protein D1007_39969 [Hordeum vulgare]
MPAHRSIDSHGLNSNPKLIDCKGQKKAISLTKLRRTPMNKQIIIHYNYNLRGPAPEERRPGEHLLERHHHGHGQRHAHAGLHHQAEHVRADHRLGHDLRHRAPLAVVHHAAPPRVGPLHLVRWPGAGARARRHVRHRLAAAAPPDGVHGPPRLLAGEHEPLLALQAEALAADGEGGAAGRVHEDDLVAALGGVAVDAVGQVALDVEHREPLAVEQQRLAPHRQRRRPLRRGAGRRARRPVDGARRGRHVGVNLRHVEVSIKGRRSWRLQRG